MMTKKRKHDGGEGGCFKCDRCQATFAFDNSRVKHMKRNTCTQQQAAATPPSPMLAGGGGVSESYRKSTLAFAKRFGPIEIDADAFDDQLNSFIDGQLAKQVTKKSMSNDLRMLLIVVNESAAQHADTVTGMLSTVQAASTRETFDGIVLACLDPAAMVDLRNGVIGVLRQQQCDTIDPFIAHVIQYGTTTPEEKVKFGLQLRCWIDLCMRFSNIPCRIQATKDMVLPSSGMKNPVAKLVKGDHGGYSRLIAFDKVGNSHQPISLPLGSTLSAYLQFYVEHCRHGDSDYVFVTKRGKHWIKASRDIKLYLEDVGFPVSKIDPTGRFVHASRNISIAAFAHQCGFDVVKTRGFALLCRHSSAIAERYYSIYEGVARANMAVDHFASVMGLTDFPTATQVTRPPLAQLSSPPAILRAWAVRDDVAPFQYAVRSVSTQTDERGDERGDMATPAGGNNTLKIIEAGSTLPMCTAHSQQYVLGGPSKNTKYPARLGRFFAFCKQCRPTNRPDVTHTVWFRNGVNPTMV